MMVYGMKKDAEKEAYWERMVHELEETGETMPHLEPDFLLKEAEEGFLFEKINFTIFF